MALVGTSQAQLANTIWRGDAKLTIPALTQYDDNADPMPYPRTTTGISVIVPVEVWFWDSSKFLVVFRQGEFGFDPARASLQPLIGEWTIPVAARTGLLANKTIVPYASDDIFESRTGSYTKVGNKYSFTARKTDTATGNNNNSIYPGASLVLSGSFGLNLKNTQKLTGTASFLQTPNPNGPNGIYVAGVSLASFTLNKVSPTPSSTGVDVFLDQP
ncbi:MAG: hypothetical protein EBT07_13710 [Actinobacteria bacterium]|nr:hypothetical protein [Actinomycetota bacterium]